jgi:hypothetical protein
MRSLSPKSEKWATAILGVVSLVLLVHLVSYGGIRAGAHSGALKPSPAARAKLRAAPAAQPADLAADPGVDLELLEALEKRPLPELRRNPFEFPPPPRPKRSFEEGAPGPATPPSLLHLPLRAIGYSQQSDQPPQAVLTDSENIYVVRAGEEFGKRYSVVSLTPTRVEIHDSVTQQTVALPIAP